jgi:phospholipid-binding lipoprotein MlaA
VIVFCDNTVRRLFLAVLLCPAAVPALCADADSTGLGDIGRLRDPGFYVESAKQGDSLDFLDIYDPLAPLNKRIYAFNRLFDEYVFLPALRGYRFIFPVFVRERFSDFWDNIGEVPNIYNSLLQLKIEKTAVSAWRLIVNTTVGIVGLWDPATRWLGLKRVHEDFGQTLGYWGLGQGAYLVIPFAGPSNIRDATGIASDWWLQQEIDFLGVKGAEWDDNRGGWTLFAFDALNIRDNIPFRYGELGSPFEYNKVRYLFSRYRELLVKE